MSNLSTSLSSNPVTLPVIKGVAYLVVNDEGKVYYSSPLNVKLFNIKQGDWVEWSKSPNGHPGVLVTRDRSASVAISSVVDFIWHGTQAKMLFIDVKESRVKPVDQNTTVIPIQQNQPTVVPWTSFKCKLNNLLEVVLIDDHAVSLTGYSIKELTCKEQNYRTLISTADQIAINQIIQKAVDGQEPYHLLYQIQTKTGELKWIEEHGNFIQDPINSEPMVEGYLVDVTDRKKVEDALWESELRYRSLVEASPDAVLLIDKDGKILLANNQFAELVGAGSPEALQGNSIFKYINLEEPLSPDFSFQNFLSSVPSKRQNFTIFGVDHTNICLETNLSIIRDSSGEISACVAIGRDIRQQRQAEQKLRENEALYRAIVEDNPEMIVRFDREGVVTFANKAFTSFIGLPQEKLLGQKLLNQPISRGNHMFRELMRVISPEMAPQENTFSIHPSKNEDRWYRWRTTAVRDEFGTFLEYQTIGEDITDQRKARQAEKESETRLSELMENIKLISLIINLQGQVISTNSYFSEITGWSNDEALNQDWFSNFVPADISFSLKRTLLDSAMKDLVPIRNENPILTKSGERRLISWTNTLIKDPGGRPAAIASIGEDITEKDEMERIQNTILKISQTTNESGNLDHIFMNIHETLKKLVSVDNFYIALYDPEKDLISFPYFVDQFDPTPAPKKPGRGLTEYVLRNRRPVTINPETFQDLVEQGEVESMGAPSLDWIGVPLKVEQEIIGVMVAQTYSSGIRYSKKDEQILSFVSSQIATVIDRKHHEQKLLTSQKRNQLLIEASTDGIFLVTLDGSIIDCNDISLQMFGFTHDEMMKLNIRNLIEPEFHPIIEGIKLWSIDHGEVIRDLVNIRKDGTKFPVEISVRKTSVDESAVVVIYIRDITEQKATAQTIVENEQRFRTLTESTTAGIFIYRGDRYIYVNPMWCQITGFPVEKLMRMKPLDIMSPDTNLEVINHIEQAKDGEINRARVEVSITTQAGETSIIDLMVTRILFEGQPAIIGTAIDITNRKQREHELEVIAKMSESLRTNINRDEVLNTAIEKIAAIMKLDGAVITLLNPTKEMIVATKTYSDWAPLENLVYEKSQGLSGHVILTGLPYLNNHPLTDSYFIRPELIRDYGSIAGVPLLVKGEIIGAMLIGSREKFKENDLRLLRAIGDLTASALHRAALFEQTTLQTDELRQAYDSTLEGWALALELRDKETQGHSVRIATLTLKLARRLQIPENEMENIRRGALLHDIGKLGVPDTILLKNGALTPEEWEIMKMHPTYAYNMLSQIKFFQDAIDIPFCHHEWYDGSGYPRGLEGKNIPLAARIFSIIDVWDALRSNRPYREAWDKDQVLSHIINQAGTHFDPDIVNEFIQMIVEDK